MNVTWRLLIGLAALLALALPASAGAAQAGICTELVVDGGFEVGDAWLLGATELMPQYVTYARHGGERSLALGITSGANVRSYSSARQTVSVPATAGRVSLSFWFYALASGAPNTDYMELVLLDPATDGILAKPWRSTNDSRTWNSLTFDLTPWRGRTVQLYFNVFNDGLGGAAAMFLDDVSLSACPAATTPAWTAPPTALPTALPTTPAPGCVDRLLNGGFESGLAYWEAQGDARGVSLATSSPHTGFYALRLGALDQNLNGLSSVRQQVAVPAGYAQVILEFWAHTFAEPGAGADYQEAALLNASGVAIATPWRVLADDRAWVRQAFDITAFGGQTLFVRFGVNNDGAGGRSAMYLDDVRLLTCNPGLPAPTATPTRTATPVPPWTPGPTAAPPGCIPLVQNGGFEAGAAPWQLSRGLLPPQLATAPVRSGSWALQLGTQTEDANSYSSARQWLAIPPTHPRVLLEFWAYTWAESLDGADRQQAVLLGPGDAVLAVPWSVLRDDQSWQRLQFDLIGLAGRTVAVYFNAINDGLGGRTALWVDDVQLWACTAGAWPAETSPAPAATPETVATVAAPPAGAAPTAEAAAEIGGSAPAVALTATAPATAVRVEDLGAMAGVASATPAADITRVSVAPAAAEDALLAAARTATATVVRRAGAQPVAAQEARFSVFERWPAGWPLAVLAVVVVAALVLLALRS